ncbi:BspA family leucine-rich repeat surface protein [Treponema sp. Marseille-Q4130]|uniref:BspA family leucine-rich repeat surface protein n=1 Tax=Treponema sp. Marseille-Q4130 TaxID=2766702 RepID=UPI001652729A|nr:BspA family leucine-rich repeat surface protein [Treponema sp. Marseille-Q4130]MBC6720214.1 BspA family leucine-rich repeat surface protein [Treponema sp. Marseille-Q4130]
MRTCLKKIGILAAAILLAALCTIGCKTEVSDETFTVEVTAGEHGTVNANPASGKVEKGTVITFTALPETDYKVDTWTITGGTFEDGGTAGSPTADVTISADTKVNVSFTPATYAEVPFGANGANLDNHLKTAAPDINGIYYIKVTGLTAADLKGDSTYPCKPSPLGKILNNNPTKKVVLKFAEISGLTDMSWCFYGCGNLTQAPVIPAGVTNMYSCFYGCTSLTQSPVIPSSVTDMRECFYGCTSLTQAPVIPSSVTDMRSCFSNCISLTQAPVIPAGVTDMRSCFSGCTSLTQAPVIPAGVTDMRYCFSGCESLTQAPVILSSVTDMRECFSNCISLTQAPVIPSSVTDMRACFWDCESLTQAPVIPSSVTDMRECFWDCESLTQAPVIPAGVTDMSECFSNCTSLTQAPVIPSSVTDMSECFSNCKKITAVTLKCNYNAGKFDKAFSGCKKLTARSIKVPSSELERYKRNALIMRTQKGWFVGDE